MAQKACIADMVVSMYSQQIETFLDKTLRHGSSFSMGFGHIGAWKRDCGAHLEFQGLDVETAYGVHLPKPSNTPPSSPQTLCVVDDKRFYTVSYFYEADNYRFRSEAHFLKDLQCIRVLEDSTAVVEATDDYFIAPNIEIVFAGGSTCLDGRYVSNGALTKLVRRVQKITCQ